MSFNPQTVIFVKPGDNLVGIVNALPNGSRVVLQPGTHTVTGSMNLNGKSNITIEGGPDSIINDTRTANVFTFRVDTTSDVTLRGFKIVAATNGGWVIDDSAGGGSATRLSLIDLTIELTGTGSATVLDGTNTSFANLLMSGCHIFGNYQYGVRFSGGSAKSGIRIVGNRFIATNRPIAAILFGGGSNQSQSVICGNHIEHVTVGIDLQGTGIACTGNTIYDTTGDGIQINNAASNDITVVGNTIESGTDEGIEIIAGSDCIISANTVRSVTGTGISIAAGAGNIVADNVITSVGEAGVYWDSVADIGICIGNRITTTGWMGIFLGYAGGSLSNCIVFANSISGVAALYNGIDCQGQTLDCIISSNVISLGGIGTDCIGIASTSARIVVSGNLLLLPDNHALWMSGVTHLLASGNLMQDNDTGEMVLINASSYCVFADNYVGLAAGDGFFTSGVCSHLVFDGGEIYDPGLHGLNPDGTVTHLDIRNIKIYSPSRGVDLLDTANSHVAITGVRVIENGSDGIEVRNDYTLIAYCKVFDTAGTNDAIEVSASYGLIYGCEVRGGSNGLQFGNGGAVLTVSHGLMTNNLVHDCGSDGIFFEETSNCSCVGNRVVGCAGNDGIQEDAVNNDNNFYGGNHVRGNGTALNLNGTNRTVGVNKT